MNQTVLEPDVKSEIPDTPKPPATAHPRFAKPQRMGRFAGDFTGEVVNLGIKRCIVDRAVDEPYRGCGVSIDKIAGE